MPVHCYLSNFVCSAVPIYNARGIGRGGKPFMSRQSHHQTDRPLPPSYVCYRCGSKGMLTYFASRRLVVDELCKDTGYTIVPLITIGITIIDLVLSALLVFLEVSSKPLSPLRKESSHRALWSRQKEVMWSPNRICKFGPAIILSLTYI